MATHDMNLANQSGASFRADLNNALQAILTNNSSASAPSVTAAYMFWADTNTGILKIRNSANDAWVELLQLDGTLTLEDGSASAVALGFRDELNTGIFSSGANNFDVSIAGTTRLNISASGINITGTVTDDGATHDGDVTFTGASANIVFDKSDNALEFADNAKARFGNSGDLEIYHDGNNSIINDAGTGGLLIQRSGSTVISFSSDGIVISDANGQAIVDVKGFEGSDAALTLTADEGDDNGDIWKLVSAQNDNTFRLQNNVSGSNVNKWLISTDGDVTQTGHLSLPDSKEIRLGDSNDLTIRHTGFNSIINDNGGGELILQRGSSDVLSLSSAGINVTDPSGEAIVQVTGFEGSDAAVQLVADQGDDNGDRWKLVSVASTNTLNFQNNISGSNATKWKVDTSGNVTQNGGLSYSGQILAPNGSTADPSYSFTNSNNMGFYRHSSNQIGVSIGGAGRFRLTTGQFGPLIHDDLDLGSSNFKFDNIFATNGTISTSDQNLKNTIATSDLGLDFINRLNPVSYKFNGKTRTHYGLIAQEIETVLGAISKPATGFGGFCKDEKDEDGVDLETPLYGLRYIEFIAPIIKALQELSAKVTALEGS